MFTNKRREFLSGLIANLGQLIVGIGVLEQFFGQSQNWAKVIFAVAAAVVLLVVAFFIHPEE